MSTEFFDEKSEQQRMLNALSANGFRTDDQHARLAWRICTSTHDVPFKQNELFQEIAGLIRRQRAGNETAIQLLSTVSAAHRNGDEVFVVHKSGNRTKIMI